MRYSNTSVEQFHLARLVDGIAEGRIGIPEFQRDFDWNENDIRSLLATVFAGWPAGSLLLLEGESSLFSLRPMEAAPPLNRVLFGVLDGQQRLTSLYHALYGVGGAVYAIKWDIAADQEIEEGIVSIRSASWRRNFGTIEQQVKGRVLPLQALRSPTAFFEWRDNALATIQDDERRSKTKEIITNLYTYRLSAIHDYEFPVVKLDRDIEPSAISRIFEKVNKTGLTLNTFDLLVAKSFDTGWNLRDRWLAAREDNLSLSSFFADDGLPLLQAISLIRQGDLRQAAVLNLTKQDVQRHWDEAVGSAVRVIEFLRTECGVIRRDFLPYFNMLAPLIALEAISRITENPALYARWFWTAGFSGMYEVGANTRLVAHYRLLRDNRGIPDYDDEEIRIIFFGSATKQSQKALWSVVNCAYSFEIQRSGVQLSEEFVSELDFGSLFSSPQVRHGMSDGMDDLPEVEFRSCLNTFIVPKRLSSVSKKLSAKETVELSESAGLRDLTHAQLSGLETQSLRSWQEFKLARVNWLVDFMSRRGLEGMHIAQPDKSGRFVNLIDL
jgi:hypothetical protein